MTEFVLLGNNGYSVQDSPEPERWVKPLLAAGLVHLEYFADHMDPLFARSVISGRSEFLRATENVLRERGIRVIAIGTGRLSYLQNLISHPYRDMREEGLRWLHSLVDLACALGARYVSGHYDYISAEEIQRGGAAIDRLVEHLLRFAEYAAKARLRGIFLEQMHSPQLVPYTIRQAEELLGRLNEKSPTPFLMQYDLGHMAHVDPSDSAHGARDKDPCEWLSHGFGSREIFVHCQQTDAAASRHWPFTAEYRARGIIDPARVIEAIERSGAERAYLSLEILYPRGTPIERIEKDYAESAGELRKALGERGFSEKRPCVYSRGRSAS